MRKTALYDIHVSEGGKMVDFHGWCLPLQYTGGILKEHANVREKAGIFDVSHMGELLVKGRGAEDYLQKMVTNNIKGIEDGRIVYSPVCYPDGGTVDDILVYKMSGDCFLLVVNAANTEKDFQWFREHEGGGVTVENASDNYAQLAVQGPDSGKILRKLTNEDLGSIKYYRFKDNVSLGGINSLVSRTGYTGEDGFEIYIDSSSAPKMWEMIMKAGREEGLQPAGLGARDTLRMEAGLPLYGNELSESISPIQAGLARFVDLNKDDFIGKDALLAQTREADKRLVFFEMTERGVPRSECEVVAEEKIIGHVTSGGYSPTLGKNIGMALVEHDYADAGKEIQILIRNKPVAAVTLKGPFYRRKKK